MIKLSDHDREKLQRHGAFWRFIAKTKGYLLALCYEDSNHAVYNLIEYDNIIIAGILEIELKKSISFKNSVNDLLEDRKTALEKAWSGTAEHKPKIEIIPLKAWPKSHGQPLYKV